MSLIVLKITADLRKIISASKIKYIYTITRLGKSLLKLTQTIKPRAPRIIAFGDEFFGPSSIHPFNAIIRNADVPYRLNINDFKCEPTQPGVDRPAFIGFEFDSNGQLKKFVSSPQDVLAELMASSNEPTSKSIKTLRRWNKLENVIANLVRILNVAQKGKL